jgi:hypothetical protein
MLEKSLTAEDAVGRKGKWITAETRRKMGKTEDGNRRQRRERSNFTDEDSD